MGPTAGQWLTQTRGGRITLGLAVGGAALALLTRGARAETPGGLNANPTARVHTLQGGDHFLTGAILNASGGAVLRVNPTSHIGRGARLTGRGLMLAGGLQAIGGLISSARADTRPQMSGGSIGGINISGTTALAAGATIGAGYAGYRMLTRGGGVTPPPLPAAAAAPVSGLRRVGGLLRRAALPLTALAVLNEASRGYTANGAAGALRGAGNALTFGLSDMAIGALPARPATANSDAHAAAVSGAQVAGANASAAIAQLAQGSSTGSPGVAVTSDGQTAGYSRNRRLASGITISETVSGYQTPVRR